MQRCVFCRAGLSEGGRFCRTCGRPQPDTGTPTAVVSGPVVLHCPKCGQTVMETDHFCRQCAQPLGTVLADQATVGSSGPFILGLPLAPEAPTVGSAPAWAQLAAPPVPGTSSWPQGGVPSVPSAPAGPQAAASSVPGTPALPQSGAPAVSGTSGGTPGGTLSSPNTMAAQVGNKIISRGLRYKLFGTTMGKVVAVFLVTAIVAGSVVAIAATRGVRLTSTGQGSSSFAATTPVTEQAAQYDGYWVNNDPHTRDITRLVISSAGQTLTVHGYGACSPADCDWGTRSETYTGDPFVILFDFQNGAPSEQLTIHLANAEGIALSVTDRYQTNQMHKVSPPTAAQFSGDWINDDPNTRGITRLVISNAGQMLTVHGYGACEPTDCDWGTRTGPFTGEPFMIFFDFGSGLTDQLTLSLDNSEGTQLEVVDVGSASGTNAYFFYKG